MMQIIKHIFELLQRRQKVGFLFVIIILAVSAVLNQFTPIAIGYLTDTVLAEKNLNFQSVIPFLLFILTVNIVNEVIKVVRRLIIEDTSTQVEKRARLKATGALLEAPLNYFRMNMTGNIHGRLNRSIEGITKLIKLIFMDFAPAVATSIASLIVIFIRLPFSVAVMIILVIPVGMLIVLRQITTQKGIRVELMNSKADMDGTMVELLGGIETIRTIDSIDFEKKRINERSEIIRGKEMKHHKAMALYDCLKFINEAVFSVLVIAASVMLAAVGRISVGTVLTAYLCFTQLRDPLRELHRILDEFSESLVLTTDYFKMVDISRDFSYDIIHEFSDGIPEENNVELRNISFSYPEKKENKILDQMSLEIKAGEFLGIAGPSGCGKSTLIKVVDKLEQAQGEVLIGGKSIDNLPRAYLADVVALVPQNPFLIADTIYNNICYGIKRKVTLEEVEEAARKAYIDETIDQLPGRYSFKISESGGNLSGGQKQRIVLARIFLRKPRILILDEATSALDNTSEKHIQQQVEKMKQEGTTIISIAHRLTTLEECDKIIVMDRGKIVQQGTYGELSDTDGIFRDMQLGLLK